MPILVECACGKSFRVKDELAGRKGRCPGCKEPLLVPRPAADPEAEALELILMEDDPPKRAAPPPLPVETSVQREAPRPMPKAASRPPTPPPPEPRPRKKRPRVDREERGGYRGPWISPLFFTGLLMMFGAIAWFVLGIILIDRIFFYPPILFVLGFISMIKGLLGHEE